MTEEQSAETIATEEALAARMRQQAAVANLGQYALQTVDLQALFDRTTKTICETLEVPYSKVLELLPEEDILLLRAGSGWGEGLVKEARVSTGLSSQAGFALHSGQPVIVDDLHQETRFDDLAFLGEHGVVSGISCIIAQEPAQPYGVLGAHDREPRSFSEDDVNFLQAVANLLGQAIQRHQAEQALRESRERFQSTFENAAVGIGHVSPEGRWLRVNERLSHITGYSRQELLNTTFQQMTHPDDLARDLELVNRLLSGEQDSYQLEKRYFHKEGHILWINLTTSLQRDQHGTPVYFISVIEDISDRKQFEKELRALNETLEERVEARTRQVRNLSAELARVEQQERERIAQVLHDDVQQMLYSLQLNLAASMGQAAPEVQEKMEVLQERVDEIIDKMRTLTAELTPPTLRSDLLRDAFLWLAAQMKEMHELQVNLDICTDCRVADAGVRGLIFRIVRELLFNVVKHGSVTEADLIVKEEVGLLSITVADGGAGFDVAAVMEQDASSLDGFGLQNVQERVELFNGSLALESQPGAGTRVTITVPEAMLSLPEEATDEEPSPVSAS